MGASDKSKVGARKISRDVIAAALRDNSTHLSMGIVKLLPGETNHFEYDSDGEDVLVDVLLVPSGVPVLCRLATIAGGANRGVWGIPPVGTEVLIAVPGGDLDNDPVIIACLSTGVVPAALDEETMSLRSPKVHIEAASGDATVKASGNVLLGGSAVIHPVPHGDTLMTKLNILIAQMAQIVTYVNGIAPGTVSPAVSPGAMTTGNLSPDVKVS